MNKKKSILIVTSLLSSFVLSGCASNTDITAQQKQHAEKIDTLTLAVNILEDQLQKQQEIDGEIVYSVDQLYVERNQFQALIVQHYVIKQGDTLSAIAAEQGITLKALLALNPQIDNANHLLIGHTINLK